MGRVVGTARVTRKGELSLSPSVFRGVPPKYVQVEWQQNGELEFGFMDSRNCVSILPRRKVYFPTPRSKAVRVSVRTEFVAARKKPADYVGYMFSVVLYNKLYTIHMRRTQDERKKK